MQASITTTPAKGDNTPLLDQAVYTVDEAAKALRVGRTTIYKAAREGRLKLVKVGRRTVIRRPDLEGLID
jgi:excisionase family DNA binding protein